jgi:uncharacterized membrane protein YgcG
MNRRILVAALCASLVTAGIASAETFADTIVQQLQDQGYAQVSVTDTLLGRTRIFARSDDAQREIILNPRTGEILRDLYTGDSSGSRIYDDGDNSGHGGGNSGQGGGDDDDGDGDGDGDNSGHGGGGGDDND